MRARHRRLHSPHEHHSQHNPQPTHNWAPTTIPSAPDDCHKASRARKRRLQRHHLTTRIHPPRRGVGCGRCGRCGRRGWRCASANNERKDGLTHFSSQLHDFSRLSSMWFLAASNRAPLSHPLLCDDPPMKVLCVASLALGVGATSAFGGPPGMPMDAPVGSPLAVNPIAAPVGGGAPPAQLGGLGSISTNIPKFKRTCFCSLPQEGSRVH